MNLSVHRLSSPAFPKLAWVAHQQISNTDTLRVWCGELVEAGGDYVVEGVWPGRFEDQDFDLSDLFYGSGVRVRRGEVLFVSSCSTLDRLWSFAQEDNIYCSNSLPALLGITGAKLLPGEPQYGSWVQSVVRGRTYQRDFAASKGALRVHYFQNIKLSSSGLTELAKPGTHQSFGSFEGYSSFMYRTAEKIGDNARDPARVRPLSVLSTVSKGYDSPVATLLARSAGGRMAFTIRSARSVVPRSDSGAEICSYLDMQCREFSGGRSNMSDELWYWAANGTLQDMNFSLFDFPAGPSVIFTGFNGDTVWESKGEMPADKLSRKDTTGLGFCEHRLAKGVIHCPVPYWGISRAHELRKLSRSPGMSKWSVGGDYDRPIPRRIAEEAGIPRAAFGQSKSATSVDDLLLWPLDRDLAANYDSYLKSKNLGRPQWQSTTLGRQVIDLWRGTFRERCYSLLAHRISLPARQYSWERHLMPWANQLLQDRLVANRDNGIGVEIPADTARSPYG